MEETFSMIPVPRLYNEDNSSIVDQMHLEAAL
jgi:hypothetical protein